MYACNGILFNHESPLRGETFVTRKITRAVAKIKLGLQEKIYIGNLNAKRDWGHAKDYVEGMWRMLQQDKPDDYVLATGITTTVRDFCAMSFKEAGITIEWEGKGEDEVGVNAKTGDILVAIDSNYYRPTEVDLLVGDASRAKKELGWEPNYDLNELVREMVKADLELFSKDIHLKEGGFNTLNQQE